MKMVNMKCVNCGAALTQSGGHYKCEYCGSLYFRLTSDAELPDALSLSVEDFIGKVEENGKVFTVKLDDPSASDVDRTVLSGRLKKAEQSLSEGKSYMVFETLKDVPDTCFAAVRLKFLAEFGAKNESELSLYAGDVTRSRYYSALESAGDEATRATYRSIADMCLKNALIEKEIAKGKEMLAVGLYEEGLEYARNAVTAHPFRAKAWELFAQAKCLTDEKYDPTDDLKRLSACPDARINLTGGETDYYGAPENIAPVIAERCRAIYGKARSRSDFIFRYVVRPIIVIAAVGALISLWKLIEALVP